MEIAYCKVNGNKGFVRFIELWTNIKCVMRVEGMIFASEYDVVTCVVVVNKKTYVQKTLKSTDTCQSFTNIVFV